MRMITKTNGTKARCRYCGVPGHSATACKLKAAAEADDKTEAERRVSWKKLQEKHGPGWWRYTKGKV